MVGVRARQHIGRYRIIAPIGVGSSATVYRALDEESGAEVAIKVLADNHSLRPDRRRRFLDEVELLTAIESPSIATIHEVGETETGQLFMVLDLADRGDLRQRVDELGDRGRALGPADLEALADHLSQALGALHRAGIVHRDVSPGNILIGGGHPDRPGDGLVVLDADERFLLADLGFAKDLQFASGLTVGGGTRGFAAPEQRADVSVVDRRADVFAATAVVGWAATGPTRSRLEPFLATGRAEDPADRYPSMEAWRAALGVALGPGSPPLGRRGGPTHHRRWALVLLAALGVAGALLGAYRARSPSPSPTPPAEVVSRATVAPAGPAPTTAPAPTEPPTTTTELATTGSTEPPATTTTQPSTTQPTAPSSTATQPSTTATTIDGAFVGSPRAFIDGPGAESVVVGDLMVTGTASHPDGIGQVELVIKHLDDDVHWHDDSRWFRDDWVRFPVPVTPSGAAEVTWSYTVEASSLPPGRYLLRVWARTVHGEGDPISDLRTIEIEI